MMTQTAEQVINYYTEAYQKLYKRTPKDLHVIDSEWVVVNGARMRASELAYLTSQLQQEYTQSLEERRNIIKRLVNWFKS